MAAYFGGEKNEANDERLYVFVVPGFADGSLRGYMPRGRNVGFVSDASGLVVAHELAHGAFGLRHTADVQPASKTNLLDYGGGTDLTATQWSSIQNPGIIINWFDDEDDAELALIDNLAGAVLGAVLDVAMQITTNVYEKHLATPKQPTKNIWDIKWWPDVAISGAAGFASSGAGSVIKFGQFASTPVGKAAVKLAVETSTDFLIGVATDAAKKYLSKEDINWTNTILTNMVSSAAFGTISNSAAFAKFKGKILQAFGAKVAPPQIPPVYTGQIVSEGFARIKAKAKSKIKAKTGRDVSEVQIAEKVEFSNKVAERMSAANPLKREKISVELSQAAREVETELAGDTAQRATTNTTPEVEDDIAAALRQAGKYSNYSHISVLPTSVLDKLDQLAWSDALLTKLNSVLGSRTGLGNELTQNLKLLNYFEGVNVNFWAKYALLREHYRTGAGSLTLPDNFLNFVRDLESVSGVKLSSVNPNNILSDLGSLFEDDVVHYVGQGFSSGGDFTHLPSSVNTQLTAWYNAGYKVMVTQPNVSLSSIGKTNAQPDVLFFKVRADNSIDFSTGAIYPDAKLNEMTAYSQQQEDFIGIVGTNDKVKIDRFVDNRGPRIFQSSAMSFDLRDDFVDNDFGLQEAGKLCTKFQNDITEFIYKKHK